MSISHIKGQSLYLLLGVTLAILAIDTPFLMPFALFYGVAMYRYDVLLWRLFMVFLCLYALRYTLHLTSLPHAGSSVLIEGVVDDVRVGEYSDRVRIRTRQGHYYFRTQETVPRHHRVRVTGTVSHPDGPTFPGAFDYPKYLKATRVLGFIDVQTWEDLGLASSFDVSTWMRERITGTPYFESLLLALVLADRRGFDPSFDEAVKRLGMMHLFAVSGLHVTLLTVLLKRGLTLIKTPNTLIVTVISVVLVTYLVLTSFAPSIMRAALWWGVLQLNQRFKLGFTALDALVFVQLMLWLWNPFNHYHMGFVLSYAMAYTLLIHQKSLPKAPLNAAFKVACLAFVFGLPMSTWMSPQVHLLTPFVNTFSVFVMSLVLLPMTYAVVIMPRLDDVFGWLPLIFEEGVVRLYQTVPWTVHLYIKPGIETALYYIVLCYCSIQHQRRCYRPWLVFVVYVSLCLGRAYWMPFASLTMYDVEGEAFLFMDAHHRCSLLIDTGDHDPSLKLRDALMRQGVNHLDVVILSHRHRDHVGAYDDLAQSFPMKTVLTPNQTLIAEDTWMHCGKIQYKILSHSAPFGEPNDDSLVVVLAYQDHTFLFTGDIEARREAQILKTHSLEATWLKIAHHGSKTSSSEAFLDVVKPTYALVSAHRQNRFGFPHETVMHRLETRGVEVFRTDQEGTITFYFWRDRFFKKSTPP